MTTPLDEVVNRTRGLRAEASATLEVSLGKIARALEREHRSRELLPLVSPILINGPQIPLSGGAGILKQPDTLGPQDGMAWDVRRLCAAGFTAGTVTLYLNNQADENIIVTWTQAGIFTFSGSLVLGDSDVLIFVAAGITGTVTISGQAINVPTPLLPDYLL